jgi:hypothetical protein
MLYTQQITIEQGIVYVKQGICQWLAAGRWFSPVSSTNKTDCHDIIEILLKVAITLSLTIKNVDI